MKKRLLSLVLAVLMMISLLPTTAWAWGFKPMEDFTHVNITLPDGFSDYSKFEASYTIKSSNGEQIFSKTNIDVSPDADGILIKGITINAEDTYTFSYAFTSYPDGCYPDSATFTYNGSVITCAKDANLNFSFTISGSEFQTMHGDTANDSYFLCCFKQGYIVTIGSTSNGTVTADKAGANSGETVTLTPNADDGYAFSSWDVYKTGEPATKVTVTNNQFAMPAYPVTVSATFDESVPAGHAVAISTPTNGTVTASGTAAGDITSGTTLVAKDDTVMLSATPAAGYEFTGWSVYKTGDSTTTVEVADGTNCFTMPDYPVTVEANFGVGEYTVTVTSRIEGTNQTVANVSGGGDKITYATGTELYTSPVTGYDFLGWYTGYSNEGNGTPVSESRSYTYQPTADITVYAVYKAKADTRFNLRVCCPGSFTVNSTNQYSNYVSQFKSGELTLEYTGSDTFLYWINAYNNIVSTCAKFTTTLLADQTYTAVVASASSAGTNIVFVNSTNASAQQLQSGLYSLNNEKTALSPALQFPTAPISYGKVFDHWAVRVDGQEVTATEAQLVSMMKADTRPTSIMVYPVYSSETTYTFTVRYLCGDVVVKTDEEESGIVGGTKMVAKVTDDTETVGGKTYYFSHWVDAAGNVLGTNKRLVVMVTADTTVNAVYVGTAGEKMGAVTKFDFQPLTAAYNGSKYSVTCACTVSLASTACALEDIVQTGFLYWNKADVTYTLEQANSGAIRKTEIGVPGSMEFGRTITINNMSNPGTTLYFRAYVLLKDGSVIYSEPASDGVTYSVCGSYNSITGQ